MSIKGDLAWVAYGLEPLWLRRSRHAFREFLLRHARDAAAAEAKRIQRDVPEMLRRHFGTEPKPLVKTYVTGTVAGGGSSKYATSWTCPTGHMNMVSSVPLTAMMCYCGRSMIESPPATGSP